MVFWMPVVVPGLLDILREPQHVLELYGPEVNSPETHPCDGLLARRLVERGGVSSSFFTWVGIITAACPIPSRDSAATAISQRLDSSKISARVGFWMKL
jgi:hypothetical protein